MSDDSKLPPGFRPTNQRRRGKTAPIPDDVPDPLKRQPRWRKRVAQPRAFEPGRNYSYYDPFAPENQN